MEKGTVKSSKEGMVVAIELNDKYENTQNNSTRRWMDYHNKG